MRPILSAVRCVLSACWSFTGVLCVLWLGYWLGLNVGYGKGARAVADLIIEMRQGSYGVSEPWDRGDI